jgi:nicotinamidase-related amidase
MIDPNDAVMLLIDHQSGLFQLVKDIDLPRLRANVIALAKVSRLGKLPTFTTASVPDGPNGSLIPEIHENNPDAVYIPRTGQINAWDNPAWVEAIEKTGRKILIIVGTLTSVCMAGRRQHLHSDGDDAFIFQPIVNYRTLEFDKALSARHICQIVNRWADFAGLNQNPDKDDPDSLGSRKKPKPRLKLSPHDLRRTAVTRALSLGFTYRQVQSMTGHKDIRMVVEYDHERGNMEDNAINFLHYWDLPDKKEGE